ncbi:multidrug resistance-associated protein 1-like [Ixodes scapularis]
MTRFCTSPLWDWDYTWYSDYPRFTPCFETTVLAYTPAALLVLFGSIPWLVGRRREQPLYCEPVAWTPLSAFRCVASCLLTLTYALSLIYRLVMGTSSGSSIAADVVHALAFTITLMVLENDRRNGAGSSMLLFSFWLLTALCKLPESYRRTREAFATDSDPPNFSELEFFVCALAYPLVILQLLLSCWTDGKHDTRRPYLTAPPVSFILFGWLSPFVLRRSRRCVQVEDMYGIPPDMMTRPNHAEWSAIWKKELDSAGYVPGDGSCGGSRPLPSLFKSIWKAYWKTVVLSCILCILAALLKTITALLLHFLLNYMTGNEHNWKGILYALSIVSANFASRLLSLHIDKMLAFVGLNVKTVLLAEIYRKMLRLSTESQRHYTIGDLVNLISVDADRIFELSLFAGYVASGLPLIIMAVLLLWQFLGVACLAGVAVMVVIMPVMAVIVSIGNKYQTGQMELKDKRLNILAEMLTNVKVLKLFAWESNFIDKCNVVRSEEMGLLKKYSYLTALNICISTCSSSMVSLASFVTYVLISEYHILDPSTAFVSLTLFYNMQYPMFIIPNFLSNVVQTRVSITRIREFLLSSEVDAYSVGRRPDEADAITIRNGTFSWSKERAAVLRNINLTVKKGQLIAVVGPVGSGKSSLVSALLGNLCVCSGSVDLVESVAYAPQCPWIQNRTIKENVLFTGAYDAEVYDMVLKACCLERDLEILPSGDLTEIGENGINLSGGQKQRVSLARTAYQKKDLFLFDDPLSAVDAHVGASLFKDLIGPRGMLKDTTRILVTHNLLVLSEVDYIVVVQGGSIVECGTFDVLKNEGSILSGLLQTFSKKLRKLSENEDLSIVRGEERVLGKEKLTATLVEKETVEEGSISLQVYRAYLRHAGPCLVIAILCYVIHSALGAYMGIWLSEWTNDAQFLNGTQDTSLQHYRMEVYVLLGIVQAFVMFFAVVTFWKVALSASTKLHKLVLDGVMRAPLSFFETNLSGRLLNRFSKDVDQLDVQLPTAGLTTLDLLLLLASSIFLICVNIPIYILIVVPVLVFVVVIFRVFMARFREVKRLESVTRSPVNNHFSETVAGLSSVRSYAVQAVFLREYDEKIDSMQTCTVNVLFLRFWSEICLELASEMLLFSILLLLIGSRDKISAGTTGLLVSYMLNALYYFTYFIFCSTEVEASLVSAERLDEYSRLTPEGPLVANFRPDPRWPWTGRVSFRSYSTRYRKGLDLVLRDIDLDVSPGEKVGIVGRTGAGKSTIALSLFRILEPAAGNIVVDGVDIATLRLRDLRSRISIIPQDPVLFGGTLRFNLDPAGQYGTEELWSALDRSHLGDTFRKNGGLDFEVSEGGLNLSVGQRQLVCLARAVLRMSKVLVLDEATASVDTKTDLLIQQTLRNVMSECTVLTIAHRLHSVITSDRIVVMDHGRILEVGSPAQLLADTTSSFYAMALEAGIASRGVKGA